MSDTYISKYARANKLFANKMLTEKYKEYRGNPKAQRILFQDCLAQTEAEDIYNVEALKGAKLNVIEK